MSWLLVLPNITLLLPNFSYEFLPFKNLILKLIYLLFVTTYLRVNLFVIKRIFCGNSFFQRDNKKRNKYISAGDFFSMVCNKGFQKPTCKRLKNTFIIGKISGTEAVIVLSKLVSIHCFIVKHRCSKKLYSRIGKYNNRWVYKVLRIRWTWKRKSVSSMISLII